MKSLHLGIYAAVAAAVLFGVGTPLAKIFLNTTDPWLMAGLLYLGSGVGLAIYRLTDRGVPSAFTVQLNANEWLWLAGAILSGGIAGPVLLMLGLSQSNASSAALLLNAEGVFTALLAWFVFKENFDKRIALGMAAIVAGAIVLSTPAIWGGMASVDRVWWPSVAILGACLAWAIDNNLTRKVSLTDASWIAMVKGLVAGMVNLLLAFYAGAALPSATNITGALVLGFFSYGLSLTLFVVALRHLGTARSGAYFSIAPFAGAGLALAMGEPITGNLIAAAALMAFGVWLHVTENHGHLHSHEIVEHEHVHDHDSDDEHHRHDHRERAADAVAGSYKNSNRHSHWHRHEPMTHMHSHFPDAHHQHTHENKKLS